MQEILEKIYILWQTQNQAVQQKKPNANLPFLQVKTFCGRPKGFALTWYLHTRKRKYINAMSLRRISIIQKASFGTFFSKLLK